MSGEHPTLKAGALLSNPALYNFSRPPIQHVLDGKAEQVSLPKACTSDEWCLFGARLATAIGEPQLSNVFVNDFPWGNALQYRHRMQPEQNRRFWEWFFSGVIPEAGWKVGETLVDWMTKGVVPTSAEIEKLERVKRESSAKDHIRKYWQIIAESAEISVLGGDVLRGGVKPLVNWDNARFIHESVAWTEENKAMSKLLRPLRQGTWEYAWSVVRQLTEFIVAEDIKIVAHKLIDWGLRRALGYVDQPRQKLLDMIREIYQEGVQIGRMADKMEEYLRWACQGHLGMIMASGLRDREQFPDPLPDPAFNLVRVWKLGYWPIGLKGSCYYIHDLFPIAVPIE